MQPRPGLYIRAAVRYIQPHGGRDACWRRSGNGANTYNSPERLPERQRLVEGRTPGLDDREKQLRARRDDYDCERDEIIKEWLWRRSLE